MKRSERNLPVSSLVASITLVVAWAALASGQAVKPGPPQEQENGGAAETGEPDKPGVTVWTCSMHPQIRLAERGACPICSMELVSLRVESTDSLISLDQMLSLALEKNPEIRAARARVFAAEAELDQTRLQVLQKIIAYREKWKARHAEVVSSRVQLEQAQLAAKNDSLSKEQRPRATAMVARAREGLSLVQARLDELEAELPFLVGQHDVAVAAAADANAGIIRDSLIPMIEQLVKVTVEDYRSGNANLTDLQPWSRRLAELRVRIATTNRERVAAVRSYVGLTKTIAEMADARYKAGTAGQRDMLAAKIRLSEAELWLSDVGGDAE